MRYLNRIAAIVSGIALIFVALLVAAFQIRTGITELDLVVVVVQIAVCACAWCWPTLRYLRMPVPMTIRWCIGGLALSVAGEGVRESMIAHGDIWIVWGQLAAAALALISGLAVAAVLVLKSERITARASYA